MLRAPRTDAHSLVRVRWGTRVAGFDNDGVESVIQKALIHFRLDLPFDDLVLVTYLDGEKLEVTDDVLKHLSEQATVELMLLPPSKGEEPKATIPEPQYQDTGPGIGDLYDPSPPHPSLPPPSPLPSVDTMVLSPPPPSPPEYQCLPEAAPALAPETQPTTKKFRFMRRTPKKGNVAAPTGPVSRPVNVRKPVVYLYPPRALQHAIVSVSLVPQWSFAHTYPHVEPKPAEDGRQEISWAVSAKPDGTLVEKDTGLQLTYLFWEATAHFAAPPSPPLFPTEGDAVETGTTSTDYFDPAAPSLGPDTPTAVLLPFAELLPYLDRVLTTLALHTAARNDFITYWLPALSKEPFVALRFLPQKVYARAAELRVVPEPDVVTRVMMLFRGVPEEEAQLWAHARERVAAVDWARVVGLTAGVHDVSLFRVLEWGAMEV